MIHLRHYPPQEGLSTAWATFHLYMQSFFALCRFWDSRDMGKAIVNEYCGKKIVENLNFLHVSHYQILCFIYQEWYNFFCLPFLTRKPLLFLTSVVKFSSSWALAFLIIPLSFFTTLAKKSTVTALECFSEQGPLSTCLHKDRRQLQTDREEEEAAAPLCKRWSWAVNQLLQEEVCSNHTTKVLNPWVSQSQQSHIKALGGLTHDVTRRYSTAQSYFLPRVYVLMHRGV